MSSALRSRARSASLGTTTQGWDPPPLRRPSRARRRQWMREAAQAAAQAAVQAAQAAAAQVAQAHVDENEVVDLMADEAGGGVTTLTTLSSVSTTTVLGHATFSACVRSDVMRDGEKEDAASDKENLRRPVVPSTSSRGSVASGDGYHGLRCRETSAMWSFEYDRDGDVTSVRRALFTGGSDPSDSVSGVRGGRKRPLRPPLVSLARTPLCRRRVGGVDAVLEENDVELRAESQDSAVASGPGRIPQPLSGSSGEESATAVEADSTSHDDVHCTCSNDQIITTSIRGLTCDPRMFLRLTHPELCELSISYLLVYVPKEDDFCHKICYAVDMSDESYRLGQGSFGEVWPLDRYRVVKVARKHSETVLTVWMSGLIRTRAAGEQQQPPSLVGTGVHRGLLTATGCCLLHNVTVHRRFHTDMFHHDQWKLACIDSYRRAFCTLADAIKFLNHQCRVCHFDITPMNVLIDVNPHNPSEIVRAALCDYSLSEPYPDYNERCVAVFQETGTARRIPNCSHRLRECYHPAFRPMPLQKLLICDPHARFPVAGLRRYCMSELSALGNVLGFCLMRLLDRRGLDEVRMGTEALLFKHAGAACRALENGKLTHCSDACLLILAAQMSYGACLLGEHGAALVSHTLRFVEAKMSSCRVRAFRRFYHECSQTMLHEYVRKNVERLLATSDGLYLYNAFRRTTSIICEEDLDGDCRQLFPE
nr:tegument serine/threonine protein kinase [Cytomegalovirus humanbeta5]